MNDERIAWAHIQAALTRQDTVTVSMILLASIVSFYLVIAAYSQGKEKYKPETWLDNFFPLVPFWVLVYGALYLFLFVVPVMVVLNENLIRRTVRAYLLVWSISYLFFWFYPTLGPRPE